jgi:DNA-binding transcriptional ArsR family regulator
MPTLKDLVVDESAFDQEALAEALLNYVRLGRAGEMRPGPKWERLSRLGRVLAVLLSLKAAWVLEMRKEDGGAASEITALSGLPGGTVRPKLRALRERGLIEQTKDGRYRVGAMALDPSLKALRAEEGVGD